MRKVRKIGRRTFLMSTGKTGVGVLSEVTFGFGRKGLAIALGGTSLATAACQPQLLQPQAAVPTAMAPEEAAASYMRVFMDFVSAYVLVRGSEIAIVDTGTPGNTAKFEDVISSAGLAWSDVNHVILTHHHGDHVDGLKEILGAATAATIYAGEADIPEIQASKPIQSVLDGDEVFGMQIIGTPGHTAGHVSVYDPVGSLLVAGDALMGNDGSGVVGPSSQYSSDMVAANQSVQKLATLTYETLVFGHGEPIEAGASDAVAALAAAL